jgi:hypothetical protein
LADFVRLMRFHLTTILPDMTIPEAIDTTRFHRVAHLTGGRTAFAITRLPHTPTAFPVQT